MASVDQPTQEFENLSEDSTNSSCKTCSGASIPSSANIYPFCNKRRSLNFTAPISDQIPKRPKKLFLDPLENNAAAAVPSFRRCCTFPPFSAFSADPNSPPVAAAANNLHQSPPPPDSVKIAESLPPRPPFKRCPSDPSPVKSFSRSGSNNDLNFDGNADYQRLKWMKDYTKEMSQYFDDVLPDETVAEEEENKHTAEDNSTDNIIKANLVMDNKESVYAERTGDSLIVHFKCSCGKGLHIVRSGANCYYKLIQ